MRRVEPGRQRLGFFSRPAPGLELRGRLLVPSEQAYGLVSARFRELGHVALFRRSGPDDVIVAVPGELPAGRSRVALALALFVATFASVLVTGALNSSGPDGGFNLLAGWPFAVSLLAILGAHEMGHYLMARRLGVPSSPPFFIPLPLSLFGTMGAVMQMKAPPRDRRALLAVAVAGPLAGLAVAVPVLLLGLRLSEVMPIPSGGPTIQEGNSLLYAGLKYLLFGRFLPSGGVDVFLHPVAWAGWAGLLVTGLNLMPAGQLDGGHVAYVLLGGRARYLTWLVIATLIGLSFLWTGWLLWAALVFIFGQTHAVPLDDITPIRWQDRAVAILAVVVFVLVFMPRPMQVG
jgi:membrane-associated protease RseP (regulator of RpoE activity)